MIATASRSRNIFKRTYGKQTNFITPHVIEHGMAGKHLAWELSTGEFMSEVFGVTVLEQIWGRPTNRRHDLSQSFGSEALARRYINQLGKE